MDKLEITKIDRTDANVDNSRYELKVPYEVSDDYGNKATLYRKEILPNVTTLQEQKTTVEKSLQDINDKIAAIEAANIAIQPLSEGVTS